MAPGRGAQKRVREPPNTRPTASDASRCAPAPAPPAAPRRPPRARGAAAWREEPGASCPAADRGGEHGLDRLEGETDRRARPHEQQQKMSAITK